MKYSLYLNVFESGMIMGATYDKTKKFKRLMKRIHHLPDQWDKWVPGDHSPVVSLRVDGHREATYLLECVGEMEKQDSALAAKLIKMGYTFLTADNMEFLVQTLANIKHEGQESKSG